MPSYANVVTTCLRGESGPTAEANRKRVLTLLDLACRDRPDLVCLPQCPQSPRYAGREPYTEHRS